MLRFILWALLALYLLVVGLWPAAAAPVDVLSAGASVVLAKLPALFLLAGGAWLYLRYRPALKPRTA
jgi:hypothetical protein